MKNKYYIFRHGETFSTKDGVPYGDMVKSAEILSEGIPAIERMANFIKNEIFWKFYSSEYLRCVETSQIVSRIINKDFEKYSKLNEMYEETFSVFRDRIKDALDNFESERDKIYLICTHGAAISALKYLLLRGEYNENDLMDFPPPGNLLVIEPGGYSIKDFNQIK